MRYRWGIRDPLRLKDCLSIRGQHEVSFSGQLRLRLHSQMRTVSCSNPTSSTCPWLLWKARPDPRSCTSPAPPPLHEPMALAPFLHGQRAEITPGLRRGPWERLFLMPGGKTCECRWVRLGRRKVTAVPFTLLALSSFTHSLLAADHLPQGR